jgi:DNA-binding GntR family transcriptional regulator
MAVTLSPALLEDALRWVESSILSGELRPGDRISESTLAARFGVGRGPLREALRTLEGRRLLERTPYAGVRVTVFNPGDVEQLLMTREALEGMAARQAAEVMTLPQTRRLRELLTEGKKGKQLDEFFLHKTQENDFHVQIAKGSGNRWLAEFLCKDLYSLLNMCRFRAASASERRVAVPVEHEGILEAIERRDPDEAERRMREHIAHGRESLLRRLREAELQKEMKEAQAARRKTGPKKFGDEQAA